MAKFRTSVVVMDNECNALTKSLLFLEQQRDDGIAIRANDLSVISRLINQVAWQRRSQCKQTSIENYVDLHL